MAKGDTPTKRLKAEIAFHRRVAPWRPKSDWNAPDIGARAAVKALSTTGYKGALGGYEPAVERAFEVFMLDPADPSHWRAAFDSMARVLFPPPAPKQPRKHRWTDEETARFVEYVEQSQRAVRSVLSEGAPLNEEMLLDIMPPEALKKRLAKIRREWKRGRMSDANLRAVALTLLLHVPRIHRIYRHDRWEKLFEYARKAPPKKRKSSAR
jgi:hypothetical protein